MKTRWSWLEGPPTTLDASLGGHAGVSWLGPTWPTKKTAVMALAEDVLPGTHTLVRISLEVGGTPVVTLAPYRLRAIQIPLLRVPRSCDGCSTLWEAPLNSATGYCPRCRTEARSAHFRAKHTGAA